MTQIQSSNNSMDDCKKKTHVNRFEYLKANSFERGWELCIK